MRECTAALFVFAAAVAAIVAVTWPWALHFNGEFLSHWDPPFHAWKLEFMARRILAGDVFMASGNTNMLYPHSGALYFEALQWPMALFAAPFFGLTALPSEVIYHVTLLFFWALSAPCMFFLLRQLDCRLAPSCAGAIVFCILPWRISYMVEFQMEMVFALPIFFAFIIRFFKTPNICDAVLVAFSWWLLAVSELYEAVFAAMAAAIIAGVLISRAPEALIMRRFWFGAVAAGLVGGSLVCILLLPYSTLHSAGQVMRPMDEIAKHAVQPFSMFLPFGRFAFWTLNADHDEFSLYPTIPMSLLSLFGAAWWFARCTAHRRSRPFVFTLATLAFVSGLLFYGIAALIQFHAIVPTRHVLHKLKYASQFFLFAPLAYALFGGECESRRATFLKALFAVAVFFLLLSFGSTISFGAGRLAEVSYPNYIYLYCYKKLLPFLSGFRVVSRFDVFVLFFLVCVSTVTLDALVRRLNGRTAAIVEFAAATALVLSVAFEAIPPRALVANYVKIDDQRRSPAIARLVERYPDVTIAALPCGPRRIEGMRMFTMIKGDWPYIYAWGGFFPNYSKHLMRLLMSLDAEESHAELSRLYPPCLVIVDCSIRVRKKSPISQRYLDDGNARFVDFGKFCRDFADEVDGDERFSIFRLRPQPPTARASKIFRSDIARSRPHLRCAVSARPGAAVAFTLNGNGIGIADASPDGVADFSIQIPAKALTEAPFNEIAACAADGTPVSFAEFSLSSSEKSLAADGFF